jgi:hypothetical protein
MRVPSEGHHIPDDQAGWVWARLGQQGDLGRELASGQRADVMGSTASGGEADPPGADPV